MSVLLVVAMFAFFIALDYLVGFGREHAEEGSAAEPRAPEPSFAPALAPGFAVEPVWVGGYQLPEDIHYHRGHTWARPIGPDTVVVGLDDFARRLIGAADCVEVPKVGVRLRQGAPGFSVQLEDRATDLLAPVEGEVIEVNPSLQQLPQLATEDPYRRGWIMKVRSAELGRNLRNLLSGTMARRWMEDAREQLELQLMALSGSVLMDGGKPVADFARHLTEEDWRRLVGEFLLT